MKSQKSSATYSERNRSKQTLLALGSIVPATSVGALASIYVPGIIGQSVALCCGIWMVIFPIYWQKYVEHQPIKLNFLIEKNSLWVGVLLGLAMFGIILAGYYLVAKDWLDITDIRARFDRMQMNVPLMVFGFGTFQTLVNSLIEEYVWRWFVYQKCEILVGKQAAIWLSALFFTLHHIILLTAFCDDFTLVSIGAGAVFLAGVIWARCFAIYRSLTPCYLSHLAADLALQIISWQVLLG